MDDEALRAAGIGEGTMRLSIGLEDRRRPDRRPRPRALRFAERLTAPMKLSVAARSTYVYTAGRRFEPQLPSIVFIHGGEQDHSRGRCNAATSPTTAAMCWLLICPGTAAQPVRRSARSQTWPHG